MMRIVNLVLVGFVIAGGAWFYLEAKPGLPTASESTRSAVDRQRTNNAGGQPVTPWTGPVPLHAQLLNNKAWTLATSRDPALRDAKRAIALATQACDATQRRHASFLDTLAAAYAEAGRFTDAVEYQQKAIAAVGPEEQYLLEDLRFRLHSYFQGQPCRQ